MKTFYVGIKGAIKRSDGAVLLLKKNSAEPFWEIPGGRIDGAESIEDTLLRELKEEVPGIKDVAIGRVLCAHRLPKDIEPNLSLMLLYFEVTATVPEPLQLSEEHTDYKWVRTSDETAVDGGTLKALEAVFE